MASLNDIAIKILVDGKQLDGVIKGSTKDLRKLEDTGDKTGKGVKKSFMDMRMGILAAAGAIAGIVIGLNKAIDAASNLQEANSKFSVVFKGVEKKAQDMRDELVAAYAMSTREASQFLSSVQDLLVPMGMNKNAAADMSGEVVKLAADLGSFNNLPTEQVMLDMQSALVGNFETMKKYGVILNETVIKNEAMNQGLWDGKGMLDANTKAQIAFELITKSSTAAVGDMARTNMDYANVKKQVTAAVENAAAKIGNLLIPAAGKLLQLFKSTVEFLTSDAAVNILKGMAFTGLVAVLIKLPVLLAAVKTALMTQVIPALVALKVKIMALYAAMGPAGWIILGVTAIIAAYIAWQIEINKTERALDNLQRKHSDKYNQMRQNLVDYAAKQQELREQRIRQEEEDAVKAAEEREFKAILDAAETQALTTKIQASIDLGHNKEQQLIKSEKNITKETEEQYKRRKQYENQYALGSVSNALGALAAIAGLNKKHAGIAKGIMKVRATVDAYAGANRALATGIPPWSWATAIFTLLRGLANVAMISAQKFARGGLVTSPTLGLVGEAGAEVIAPKQTYIDVHNKMIQSGQIGGNNLELVSAMNGMREDLSALELRVEVTSDELAIILEKGNANIALRTY